MPARYCTNCSKAVDFRMGERQGWLESTDTRIFSPLLCPTLRTWDERVK